MLNRLPQQKIEEFNKRVENLIAEDQIQTAIDELIRWTRRQVESKEPLFELLLISSEFRSLRKEYVSGTISFSEYQTSKNQLNRRVLMFVNEIHRTGELL
ncbi:MAG: hypothetical protein MRZ79_17185 [Bacteroidia bacterium]|nr:hypothetical protein [Bacteroidia bacterium]